MDLEECQIIEQRFEGFQQVCVKLSALYAITETLKTKGEL